MRLSQLSWRAFLLASLSCLAYASPALAEPTGNPFEVAREQVRDLGVTPARTGEALAFWSGDAGPAGRLLRGSSASGSRFSFALPGTPQVFAVAHNPRLDQRLHVWTQSAPDAFSSDLYAQVHDSTGAPVGSEQRLHVSESWSGVWEIDVLYDPRSRRYLVTYVCCGDEASYWRIRALLLDEGGQPLTGELTVSGDGKFALSPDAALRRRDGSYLVVWDEFPWEPEPRTIRGQVLAADGSQVGEDDFLVSAHSNLVRKVQNVDPSVAVDPETNQALVVWSDQYEVFGRRIGADGRPTGSDIWLSRMGPPSDPAWLTRHPDVAYNPDAGQYLTVWQSGPGREGYPAEEVIYGQHVDRQGRQIGSNDFAIATRDRAVEPVTTAVPGTRDFQVAWSSLRASPSAWGRRVSATRSPAPARQPEADPVADRPPLREPVLPGRGDDPSPPVDPPDPSPPVDVLRDVAKIRVAAAMSRKAFVRRGLRLRVTCASPCRATARLTLSKATARRLKLGRTLARGAKRLPGGRQATLVVRPAARGSARLRRGPTVRATLRVTVTSTDGRRLRYSRRVVLR